MKEALPNTSFLPWHFGSQSCEKMFRALRSMTGTFSTIINFSLLGLLRRLHKLHIQEELQSKEEASSTILIPRLKKLPHESMIESDIKSIQSLCHEQIKEILESAQKDAQESIIILGMADHLKENGKWNIPPIPSNLQESEEDDEDEIEIDNESSSVDNFTSSNETIEDMITDIHHLEEKKVVTACVKQKAKSLRTQIPFKKSDGHALPVYTKSDTNIATKNSHSPFVKVGEIYIRKQTAVWLFQDTEKVSNDRIFRVRAKQPYDGEKSQEIITATKSYHKKCHILSLVTFVFSSMVIKSELAKYYSLLNWGGKEKGKRLLYLAIKAVMHQLKVTLALFAHGMMKCMAHIR